MMPAMVQPCCIRTRWPEHIPPSEWLKVSETVLHEVNDQDPLVVQLPANKLRLRSDVATPRNLATGPILRPDLRFREPLKLWNDRKNPRP